MFSKTQGFTCTHNILAAHILDTLIEYNNCDPNIAGWKTFMSSKKNNSGSTTTKNVIWTMKVHHNFLNCLNVTTAMLMNLIGWYYLYQTIMADAFFYLNLMLKALIATVPRYSTALFTNLPRIQLLQGWLSANRYTIWLPSTDLPWQDSWSNDAH